MCLIHDWNFWKTSVDILISLEVLEKGSTFNISCLTSFMAETKRPVLKLKLSPVTDLAEKGN
jgi:hypothetical protein